MITLSCNGECFSKMFAAPRLHQCLGGNNIHILIMVCFCSGWILIDRSGKHFGSILSYLRDGTVTLPKGGQAIKELMSEAKYYLIQGLVELCQNTLQVSYWPIFIKGRKGDVVQSPWIFSISVLLVSYF